MEEWRGFTSLFRRFRALVLRREVEVIGQCKLCGDCCHDILLRDKGRWIKTQKQFRTLCDDDLRNERFEITGKDEFGHLIFTCSFQAKDGSCTCYEDRRAVCKNYPGKTLYYQGGWLRPECGFSFKVTTFRDVFMRRKRMKMPKFSEVLEQEKKKA